MQDQYGHRYRCQVLQHYAQYRDFFCEVEWVLDPSIRTGFTTERACGTKLNDQPRCRIVTSIMMMPNSTQAVDSKFGNACSVLPKKVIVHGR